jgi:dolichyl-phosphate-mannose--protein O-mannosyl transferase
MSAMPTAVRDDAAPAPSTYNLEAYQRIQNKLRRPMPNDAMMGWLLPLLVTLLGGIARFWRLSRPGGHAMTSKNDLVFDETYYAHDSWSLLHHGVETTGQLNHAAFIVHPPLGKWMMAVGEAAFDHGKTVSFGKGIAPVAAGHGTIYPSSTFSFRFMGVLLGCLAILMVGRIARRMFRSTALGTIAAVLFALDGLEFVQARTAMLDIYLMFWILAAFGCLILDRDDGRRRLSERLTQPLHPTEWGPSLGLRPWRLATGLCLGAACATKWDGAFYIPAFIILAIAWDIGARRTAGSRNGLWWGAAYSAGPVLTMFIVVPIIVYITSWTGWFMSNGQYAYDHDAYVHPGQSWFGHDLAVFHGWWKYQQEIWHYANTLDWTHNPHPYLSRPWGWLVLARPVAYYYQSPSGCPSGNCSQEILGLGNPALWWPTIPAMIAVAWTWVARRDWRAPAILLVFAFGYLPWFREDMHHRVMFLFYMVPNIPFMVFAVTMGVGLILGKRHSTAVRRYVGMSIVATYLGIVIVMFGYFYPILAGRTIDYDAWHSRMWFGYEFGNTCQAPANEHTENAPCWI